MKRSILMLAAALFFISCSNSKKEEPGNNPKETPAPTVAATGNPADEVINEYMLLKDALVKEDMALVNNAAQKISSATEPGSEKINSIPDSLRSGYSSISSEIHSRIKALASAPDLKVKRTIFKDMTSSVRRLVENHGSKSTVIYQQHCPMAFDNTGASWLSMETKIRNPYLPKTMLKCGRVEDTVKAKN